MEAQDPISIEKTDGEEPKKLTAAQIILQKLADKKAESLENIITEVETESAEPSLEEPLEEEPEAENLPETPKVNY